jgi:hypothetical protein
MKKKIKKKLETFLYEKKIKKKLETFLYEKKIKKKFKVSKRRNLSFRFPR